MSTSISKLQTSKIQNQESSNNQRKIKREIVRVKYFANDTWEFNLNTNLLKFQQESFSRFFSKDPECQYSLYNILQSAFPVFDGSEQVKVDFLDYNIEYPSLSPKDCQNRGTTYAAKLNIKLSMTYKLTDNTEGNKNGKRDVVKEEWFAVGYLPIQTNKCSFIINGNERYVISQIKRCPGMFLSKESDMVNKLNATKMYMVKMIPNRGSWLEFCIDSKDVIYVRIDRKKKIEFTTFLMCFPDSKDENKTVFTRSKILQYFYPVFTIEYLGKEKLIRIPVKKELLHGKLFSTSIQDESGNILVEKKKFVNIEEISHLKQVYMPIKGLVDFISLRDVFNSKTGEIYMEAGDNFTELFVNYLSNENHAMQYEVIGVGILKEDYLILNTIRKEKNNSRQEALAIWARLMKHSEYAGYHGLHTYFVNSYLNKKLYDMSTIGRRRCMQKISKNLLLSDSEMAEYKDTKVTYLVYQDIISMVQNLVDLYKREISEDDSDSYTNRRIRAVGELMSLQVAIGLEKIIKKFTMKNIAVDNITNYSNDILNIKKILSYLYEFFNTSQLSQFASQENALSQVAHSKKVSVFGVGGISSNTTAISLRDVQPDQFGLICATETPEGNQVGLVTNLTIAAELDNEGFIVAPFYVVKKGVITGEIIKLGAFDISQKVFAPKDSFKHNKEGKLEIPDGYIMCKQNNRMEMFHKDQVEITQVSPLQMFSAPTALSLASNNNDGYRNAMSAAMSKQAIATERCEPPLVGTGMEKYVAQYSGEVIKAKNPGIVRMVDSKVIVIETTGDDIPNIDLYELKKSERSNQDTSVNQTPLVKIGDLVNRDDIIADGYSMYHGELAIGNNFITLYLANKYCYEDAILVNEDMVYNDAASSIHVYSYEVEAQDTRYGTEEITRDLPDARGDETAHLDECGIISVGEVVYPGRILVGKITPQGGDNSKDPQKKLLQAMFFNRTENYKKTPLIVPPSIYGKVTKVQIFAKAGVELNDSALMNFKIELEEIKSNTDKSKNIFMNFLREKVFSCILDKVILSNVGKLPKQTVLDESHYPSILDLSINQLKIINTPEESTNKKIKSIIHQIEKKLLLVDKEYEERVNALNAEYKFSNDTTLQKVVIGITSRVKLRVGDKFASRHGNKGVVSKVMSRADMPYLADGRVVDMVLNPLGILGRMNLGQLYELLVNICTEKMRTCISSLLKQYLKFQNKETLVELQKAIVDGVGGEEVGDFFIGQPSDLKIWDLTDCETIQLAHKLSSGIYAIMPPFESVNLERIQSLLKKHSLSPDGKVQVFDGKTSEALEGFVLVGKQFILKLSHMVVNKLHYRCTGPYLYHTEQPTHGRQREGGQKIGEMENWANAANGAAFICQETIVKSDNAKLRKECFAQHSTNSLFSLLMRHVKKELNNFVNKKDQDYIYNKDDDTVEPSFALVREELFACCFKMKKQKIMYTEHAKNEANPLEELENGDVSSFIDMDPDLLEEKNLQEKIKMYKDDSIPRYREIISFALASPEDIIRTSHGMVTNTETLNYRTRNPEKNGLFCEVIFGPVNNYECICKKYTQKKYYRIKCDKCGVTVLHSSARRYRRGYIQLAYPMVHPFYLKPNNNKICTLLNLSYSELMSIIALDAWIVHDPKESKFHYRQVLSREDVEKINNNNIEVEFDTGAKALRSLLEQIDFEQEKEKLKREIKGSRSSITKKQLLHRLAVIQRMEDNQIRPEWMILTHVPVLPANLRQIVEIAPNEFASSDLNSLYRELIGRNNRLSDLITLDIKTIMYNEIRMTQASLNALFGGTVNASKKNSTYKHKSLSEFLQGKNGRFRQNLLGKRVDYSGRSVIVVAPDLALDECYLPRKMMAKILSPQLVYALKNLEISNTWQDAQKIIDEASKHVKIWDLLEEVSKKMSYVLLNRAPSLHRLSIAAFKYRLWNEDAIGLHPLVCKAFNADFDGDQMAVHLPVSIEGQFEAEILMLPSKNIASPTDGKIVIGPRQDITIGLYTLTLPKNSNNSKKSRFSNIYEVQTALALKKINAREEIFCHLNGKWEETTVGRILIWNVIPKHPSIPFSVVNKTLTEKEANGLLQIVRTYMGDKETARFADAIKELGFEYAEKFGISISLDDFPKIIEVKQMKMAAFNKQKEYELQYSEGLITEEDKTNKIYRIWTDVIHKVHEKLEQLVKTDSENPVFLSILSKARGSTLQLLQILGLKGFVARVDGSTSNFVISDNYIDGLSSFQQFAAQSGARNAGANSSLKTSQSGYLTRKLVDCAHSIVVNIYDCDRDDDVEGITASHTIRSGNLQFTLGEQISGRVLAAPIKNPLTGQIVFNKNHLISNEDVKLLDSMGIVKCKIRSPVTCKSTHGVCVMCYGTDLSNNELVVPGEAVGIIAAQSIGEPGSQLTLKSKTFGGVTQQDTTSTTVKSVFDGIVHYSKIKTLTIDGKEVVFSRGGKIIILNSKSKTELIEYVVPYGAVLLKKNGSAILQGDLLAEWDLFQPIFSEVEGICHYENIIDHITCDVIFDDILGRSQKIIKSESEYSAKNNLIPALVIMKPTIDQYGKEINEEITRYVLEDNTVISVYDGELIKVGTLLGKIQHNSFEKLDIVGGLPLVTAFLENRQPKIPSILAPFSGYLEIIKDGKGKVKIQITNEKNNKEVIEYILNKNNRTVVYSGEYVEQGDELTFGTPALNDILRISGVNSFVNYVINGIQEIYAMQGIKINNKHFEVILSRLLSKVIVKDSGDSLKYVEDEIMEYNDAISINRELLDSGKKLIQYERVAMGLTSISLKTRSLLSAMSFQETTRVLADSVHGDDVESSSELSVLGVKKTKKVFPIGLKESLISGELPRLGTGFVLSKIVDTIIYSIEKGIANGEITGFNKRPTFESSLAPNNKMGVNFDSAATDFDKLEAEFNKAELPLDEIAIEDEELAAV